MKVKDLKKLLEILDPEQEIFFGNINNDESQEGEIPAWKNTKKEVVFQVDGFQESGFVSIRRT